jgi:hypothetical protein
MKVRRIGDRKLTLAAVAVMATIALGTAGAAPAEAVPIQRGQSALILDQGIFSVLDPLGVGILPVAPAVAVNGGEAFPISGGRVSRNGQRARINHRGGIVFGGDTASVRAMRPRVVLNATTYELSALVGGQRISLLNLSGGSILTPTRRRMVFRGVDAFLTFDAANALNQAFATDQFQEGVQVGRLRVRMRLAS